MFLFWVFFATFRSCHSFKTDLGDFNWFVVFSAITGWLVGGLELFFHSVGNFIIPTDEFIFFRGVGQPPTRFSTGPWPIMSRKLLGSAFVAPGGYPFCFGLGHPSNGPAQSLEETSGGSRPKLNESIGCVLCENLPDLPVQSLLFSF